MTMKEGITYFERVIEMSKNEKVKVELDIDVHKELKIRKAKGDYGSLSDVVRELLK